MTSFRLRGSVMTLILGSCIAGTASESERRGVDEPSSMSRISRGIEYRFKCGIQ